MAADAPDDAGYSVKEGRSGGAGGSRPQVQSPGGKILEVTNEDGKRFKVRQLAQLVQKQPAIPISNRFTALSDDDDRSASQTHPKNVTRA